MGGKRVWHYEIPLFRAPTGLADGLAQKEQRYVEHSDDSPQGPSLPRNHWFPRSPPTDGEDSAMSADGPTKSSAASRRLRSHPLPEVVDNVILHPEAVLLPQGGGRLPSPVLPLRQRGAARADAVNAARASRTRGTCRLAASGRAALSGWWPILAAPDKRACQPLPKKDLGRPRNLYCGAGCRTGRRRSILASLVPLKPTTFVSRCCGRLAWGARTRCPGSRVPFGVVQKPGRDSVNDAAIAPTESRAQKLAPRRHRPTE
jgi:hypothetical protein